MTDTPVASPPTLFISHGAPNLLLGDLPVKSFLEGLGNLVARPRAILCVSAHWLTREPTVDVSPRPRTIHDFSGFEPELHDMTYNAPGAVDLATEVADTLAGTGLEVERVERGLDHGAWVPLRAAWPWRSFAVKASSLSAAAGRPTTWAPSAMARSCRTGPPLTPDWTSRRRRAMPTRSSTGKPARHSLRAFSFA